MLKPVILSTTAATVGRVVVNVGISFLLLNFRLYTRNDSVLEIYELLLVEKTPDYEEGNTEF